MIGGDECEERNSLAPIEGDKIKGGESLLIRLEDITAVGNPNHLSKEVFCHVQKQQEAA